MRLFSGSRDFFSFAATRTDGLIHREDIRDHRAEHEYYGDPGSPIFMHARTFRNLVWGRFLVVLFLLVISGRRFVLMFIHRAKPQNMGRNRWQAISGCVESKSEFHCAEMEHQLFPGHKPLERRSLLCVILVLNTYL